MRILLQIVVLAPFWFSCVTTGFSQDKLHPLFERGVGPLAGITIPLEGATLDSDMNAQEKLSRAETLAGRIAWERFASASINAPVAIDIDAVNDANGNLLAHKIHSAFIVYAPMAALRDEEMMRQIFGPGGAGQGSRGNGQTAAEKEMGSAVPPEVLAEMGIAVNSESEGYALVRLPLLNKIQVSGVVHVVKRERPDAVQIVWEFDDRFAMTTDVDSEYVNAWQPLDRGVAGEKQHYHGCAGFMNVTQLDKATGQLLVESRTVMHEPAEWFRGSKLLRSKLPISVQENARSFRRKLQKISETLEQSQR